MKLYSFSFLALLVPSIAAAHIGVASGPAQADKTGQKITFAISHGCNNSTIDTLSIQVDIPTTGVQASSVRPMPSDFDPKPAISKNNADVTSVKWTRDPADLQDGDFAYYELTLRMNIDDVPFTRIPFTITQVCRPAGGAADGSDDVTVVWTGDAEPNPAPKVTVVPTHALGWHKLTLPTAVAFADFKYYFADTQIVWKGTSAFSPNQAVNTLIGMTPGVTPLDSGLAAGDEIWVKY